MPTPPLVVRIILEIVVLMSVIRLAWIFIDRYVRNKPFETLSALFMGYLATICAVLLALSSEDFIGCSIFTVVTIAGMGICTISIITYYKNKDPAVSKPNFFLWDKLPGKQAIAIREVLIEDAKFEAQCLPYDSREGKEHEEGQKAENLDMILREKEERTGINLH